MNRKTLRLFEDLGSVGERMGDFSRSVSPENLNSDTIRGAIESIPGRVVSYLLGSDGAESQGYDPALHDYLQVRADVQRALDDDYSGFMIKRTYDPITLSGQEVYAKNEGSRITIPADLGQAEEDYVLAHETGEVGAMRRKGRTGYIGSNPDHVEYEANVLTALHDLAQEGNRRADDAYRTAMEMHFQRMKGNDDNALFSERAVEKHMHLLNRSRSYMN